jgi:hypothetical protein
MANPIELAGVARVAGGVAKLVSVSVLDEDDQGIAFDILLLDASTSLGTVNNAMAASDALGRGVLGRMLVPAASFYDIGDCKFATVTGNTSTGNLPMILKCGSSTTSLYVALVSRGTGTYTASGLRIKFGFEQ